ncbi:MAG TPA: J domain-containing protein [Candidatus Limnocylindrales bacterium]|nr:J domain-containing protein [Candidatus Limnocylindrales bacterium]
MTDAPDPYKVLQVDPDAEDEVIQAAYRRLAQKYHPDVAIGPDGAARMASINAAWEILRDPARKASLDLARRLQRRAAERRDDATTPASAASAPAAPSSATVRDRGADQQRPAETTSSDWTAGRSSQGSGYDPSRMRAADGFAAAGPPPGDPSGSVLTFGRYAGWSLGEIGRRDLEYLEWLDRMPIGRPYRDEIDAILRRTGRRRSAAAEEGERRGLFRRR